MSVFGQVGNVLTIKIIRPYFLCQTHLDYKMRTKMYFLVLFGLLAVSQARPEGYNYPQQPQQLQLSRQSQSSASFQQSLPQLQQVSFQAPQQVSFQAPQQVSLSQNQGQYSSLSSGQYSLPSIPAPAPHSNGDYENLYRQTLPQAQQPISLVQTQQTSSYQQSLPQVPAPVSQQISLHQNQQASVPQIDQRFNLPQNQLSFQQNLPQIPVPAAPQLVNVLPQTSHLEVPQNLPLQPQNFQIQSQPTFNQLPESFPQQQVVHQGYEYPAQAPIITKHIYVHVAPEEPPLPPPVIPQPPPPRKAYKIIFIKAPSPAVHQRQVIHVPAPQQTVEEKTLVYVLVNKPQQPEIVVPPPAPTPVSKPEVYFIKYRPSAAHAPSTDLGIAPDTGSLPIVEDLKREQPINSGESTSSLFSGGLPQPNAKYGPPGYQKRNVHN